MLVAHYKTELVSYKVEEPLVLECGDTLRDLRIQYTTHGSLNYDQSNIVWVFHALTANSNPVEWWPGLVGDEYSLDPNTYFIICANVVGSCYGSTEPKGFDFPLVTIRDMVKAHQLLKDHLGIKKIKIGIGGSLGGQQLLEWAVQEPDLFEWIVPLATNAKHSAWGIAFNESQRMALQADPEQGMETARSIAMLSYRHYKTYQKTQTDLDNRKEGFSASSYQQYQGQKLAKRFSPYSYYALSRSMDSHNVGRCFESCELALSRIRSKAIIIGIDTDLLFPVSEQEYLKQHIPDASLYILQSAYGHDGFLIEAEQINHILKNELT